MPEPTRVGAFVRLPRIFGIPAQARRARVVQADQMGINHQLTNAYDVAAGRWRSKVEGLGYAAAYRWLVQQANVQTAMADVIDIGCGTGEFSRALVEVAGPPKCLRLLDPSVAMLDMAMQSLVHFAPELQRVQARLEDAPAASHDIVLCAHVIEHCPNPRTALRYLKDQLAADGRLLLVVSKPHWCNWIIWMRWRHQMIKPSILKSHLKAVGLACIWDARFPVGPPSRSSHAYLITHEKEPHP